MRVFRFSWAQFIWPLSPKVISLYFMHKSEMHTLFPMISPEWLSFSIQCSLLCLISLMLCPISCLVNMNFILQAHILIKISSSHGWDFFIHYVKSWVSSIKWKSIPEVNAIYIRGVDEANEIIGNPHMMSTFLLVGPYFRFLRHYSLMVEHTWTI